MGLETILPWPWVPEFHSALSSPHPLWVEFPEVSCFGIQHQVKSQESVTILGCLMRTVKLGFLGLGLFDSSGGAYF